jgi:hypothetical protein
MTFDDLATLFRLAVDDCDATDPLWTDLELANYMDGAQKTFARRTDYFSDASTVEITQIAFVADDTLIPLDPRVTKIRSAKLITDKTKIEPVNYADMENRITNPSDYNSPFEFGSALDWESSNGTPRYLVTDMETNMVRLAPTPVVADTVQMMVYRLPLEDITESCQDLEVIEEDYQRGLLFYMKYMAYGKNDVDTYDERLQITALSNHENFIETAKRQLRRTRFSSSKGVVRYGGL